MKKRMMLFVLLFLAAALLPLMANAEAHGSCGPDVKWSLTDSGVLTISGTGKMNDYDFEKMPAPWDKEKVKQAKIGQGVTSIGNSAFFSCYFMTSLTIPSSVTSIGSHAIEHCSSLKSLKMPNSVTQIGEFAVSYNESLTSLTLSNRLTRIPTYAFFSCTKLKSVTIPASVTAIGDVAFECCSGLTTMTIPKSVTSIGSMAFAYCESLKSITIPNSVTMFSPNIFLGCSDMLTIYCNPESLAKAYAVFPENNLYWEPIPVKPEITVQPAKTKVNEGKTATFRVEAEGATGYQWYWRASSDAAWNKVKNKGTLAVYQFTAAAKHNGYQYRCLVKNSFGQVYSSPAGLTVKPKPIITAQPANAKVNESQKATFKVTATGASSYQWYYRTSSTGSWKKCAGASATTASRTVTAKASYNGYQYRCLLKNSVGTTVSSIVTLTVRPKPVITAQPKSAKVNEGNKVTFKVTAKNAASYQWYYRTSASGKWQKCAGSDAVTASRTVVTKAKYNGYQYRCLVKNSAGSVASSIVTLTVQPKPVITGQPTSVKVSEGKKAVFKVTATGATGYQWYYRTSSSDTWQKCAGSDAATASRTVVAKAKYNGYQYRCLVKNSAGSVATATVTLTVQLKPVITAQPKNATVTAGKTATFTVKATGADSYQWYFRKSASGVWQKVTENSAAATLKVTAAKQNGYQYRCLVKNAVGSVYSSIATIAVK